MLLNFFLISYLIFVIYYLRSKSKERARNNYHKQMEKYIEKRENGYFEQFN
jgi:hypothetical protein